MFRFENILLTDEKSKKLGEKAYTISDPMENCEPDSDDEDNINKSFGLVRMASIDLNNDNSVYSSSEDEETREASPVPEDSNS